MIDRIPLRAHYVKNSNHCMPRPTNQSNLVFGQTKPIQYWITDGAKWFCSRSSLLANRSSMNTYMCIVYTGKKKGENKLRKYFLQKCIRNAEYTVGCGVAQIYRVRRGSKGCGVTQTRVRRGSKFSTPDCCTACPGSIPTWHSPSPLSQLE